MKLGCKPEYDEKSRNYPVSTLLTANSKSMRSYTWRLKPEVMLDQGNQGSCVGHGWAHELLARPAEVPNSTHADAVSIYYDAQRLDSFKGGEFPGASSFSEGTSVLAGAKATMITGFIGGYSWAFTFEEFGLGVTRRGPAVVGTHWMDRMNTPDAEGIVSATGSIRGGHCYLVLGYNMRTDLYICANSWGPKFGILGKFYIPSTDMERLLSNGGVACFADRRVTK